VLNKAAKKNFSNPNGERKEEMSIPAWILGKGGGADKGKLDLPLLVNTTGRKEESTWGYFEEVQSNLRRATGKGSIQRALLVGGAGGGVRLWREEKKVVNNKTGG